MHGGGLKRHNQHASFADVQFIKRRQRDVGGKRKTAIQRELVEISLTNGFDNPGLKNIAGADFPGYGFGNSNIFRPQATADFLSLLKLADCFYNLTVYRYLH